MTTSNFLLQIKKDVAYTARLKKQEAEKYAVWAHMLKKKMCIFMSYRQYWVGQKGHSGFFVTSCGKKPNEHFGQFNIWKNIHENK